MKYPHVIPYLTVSDVEKSITFFQEALGFSLMEPAMKNDEGVAVHAEVTYQNMSVMMGLEGSYDGTCKTPHHSGVEAPVSLYIYCDDVDSQTKTAAAAGAKVLAEPADMFWGDRMSRIEDADGYRYSLATPKKDH